MPEIKIDDIPKRSDMLTEQELAELWGICVSTLQHWRGARKGNVGPRYYKIGYHVFYHKNDIAEYARGRFFQSTGERVINDGEANNGNKK